ncbi:MAG: hypothetical protein ABI865_13055 [Nitrosospira sp.]
MTATSSLWHSREHALISLKEEYPEAINVLGELFSVVDDCGTSLFEIDSAFSRVTAITVAKSRNLAHGCYSLALDSLAQESGALVRPLIETIELLKYFRLKPSRAMEAIEGKLPKAGKIAQLIGSEHKGLREYLNDYSSHISLSRHATRHLLDFKSIDSIQLRMQQGFRLQVVATNLHTLYSVLSLVGIEAVRCTQAAECENKFDLAERMEDLKYRGQAVFDEATGRIKKQEDCEAQYHAST